LEILITDGMGNDKERKSMKIK